MADHDRFVYITVNGSAFTYDAGRTYWNVLDHVYELYRSAGSNWDRPNMLLLYGKVVVESKLSEHAWNYGQAKQTNIQQAITRVQESQKPEWLT